MSTFDFRTLRITVRQVGEEEGQPVFQAILEAPRARPAGFQTIGAVPEAAIALDLVSEMRRVFALGIESYVRSIMTQEPEADEGEIRNRATVLFGIAQSADDEDIVRAERDLRLEASPPEMREATETLEKVLSRTFELGNVKIAVNPHGMAPSGHVWFRILMEAPGVRDEDMMMRPPSYATARVAQDHIKVIRRTLEKGVPWAVQRHLEANYLGDEWRPQAEEYMTRLDAVGRAMGDAELARIEDALEREAEREVEERHGLVERFKKTAEEQSLEELRERERDLENRIRELRARRGKK